MFVMKDGVCLGTRLPELSQEGVQWIPFIMAVVSQVDGVECIPHHPGSRGMAGIILVKMPLFSLKDPAVATFHQSRA